MGKFVVVFENLEPIHLNKDVGEIPRVLAEQFGVEGYIVSDLYIENVKHLIRPRFSRSKLTSIRYFGAVLTLREIMSSGDTVNLYHLCAKTIIQVLLVRLLIWKDVKIYIKLDMNTTDKSLAYAAIIAGVRRPSGMRELLVKFGGRLLCYLSDLVSVESERCYSLVSKWPVKVVHLPNGINSAECLSNLGGLRRNKILSVARHGDENKRSEAVLRAFVEADLPGDWTLEFIGSCTDSFLEFYNDMIKANPSFARRIALVGNITDRQVLLQTLAQARVFVALSKYESGPLALLEAASCGCFCVSTNVGCAPEIVAEQGILLDTGFTSSDLVLALRTAVSEVGYFDHAAAMLRTSTNYAWDLVLQPLINNLVPSQRN